MRRFGGQELYRLLVERSLGMMCVHDMDGVLLAVNPAVAQSLGYSIEEGVGRNLRTFLVPGVQGLFDRYLERIRTNGSDSGLMRLVAKDGSERTWLYRNALYEEPGSPARVLGHALDITDRMEAERELKEARNELRRSRDELALRVTERTAELEHANERLRAEIERRERLEEELLRARYMETLGMLAGGIAHDLNNFLTIVQGNTALARTHLNAGDPIFDLLDQISRSCLRAAALGQQLLAFSKGGAPVRRTVAIAPLIRDAVELARAGSPVGFELRIAADLWAAEIDAAQISQALHNLLLNARQAMPGGGEVEVRAENAIHSGTALALAEGRYVRITVRDFGSGFPPESLARVFDPYFTSMQTGSGLGLTTAYAIAARHGGAITVRSEPAGGCTFCLFVPASERVPMEPAAPSRTIQRGTGRILVMDDEEAIRKLLRQMLVDLGYEVEAAKEGAEAVAMYQKAKAESRPFAAVLVDLTVPGGMGGKETVTALHAIDPAVKVIVSSGYSEAPVMAEFRNYGFHDVLPKPWTPVQLSEVIRRVLTAE